jgi:hypothetical protein
MEANDIKYWKKRSVCSTFLRFLIFSVYILCITSILLERPYSSNTHLNGWLGDVSGHFIVFSIDIKNWRTGLIKQNLWETLLKTPWTFPFVTWTGKKYNSHGVFLSTLLLNLIKNWINWYSFLLGISVKLFAVSESEVTIDERDDSSTNIPF